MSFKTAYSLAYRLWKCRLADEKIAHLYAEQEMRCPVHLSIGQEAVAAGVCEALRPEDTLMSGHRAHAHYLARGGNLSRLMAEMYGKATGCCFGRGGSMHLIDLAVNFLGSTPIVAGTVPVAVGVGWSAKLQGRPSVSTVFFGEAATEEGVWHESMNFAALHQLPVLFVCEHNLYSVYTPLHERQAKERSLVVAAAAYGMRALRGDGNNVLEVYRLAQDALAHIRADRGPVFLEFSTYRWREHCGPNYDNDIGYRSEAEFLAWQKLDPLPAFRSYVETHALISPQAMDSLIAQVNQEIEFAVDFAKASPLPEAAHFTPDSAYAK
ncbi:MAG: thiamine pyrophosphate-dependent dehydrogenase E1 component subunit alpha [Candidatus Andersenbacteria bacterium]|nr:thiamine pyrophosphate-dependent dehydrogenase E1 component subunit alpha [Candidatus Andersenbacteria bacterium]